MDREWDFRKERIERKDEFNEYLVWRLIVVIENLLNIILLKKWRWYVYIYKISDYYGLFELLYFILGKEFKSINLMFLYCCLD